MRNNLEDKIARTLYSLENRSRYFKRMSPGLSRMLGHAIEEKLQNIRQWSLLCASVRTGECRNKKNCWEYSGCRKEVHGSIAGVLGVCPAALESRLDGLHGGRNGGRACWAVQGTLCHGHGKPVRSDGGNACMSCGFYQSVRSEEGSDFIHRVEVLSLFLR